MDPFVYNGTEYLPAPQDLSINPYAKLYALRPSEQFWRDRVPFLRERGYSLRRRYQPHWVPDWPMSGMRSMYFEDCWQNLVRRPTLALPPS